MNIQETNAIKVNIFSGIFKVVLKPLINAVKKEFKEHALEYLIEIVKDIFDKDEEEVTTQGDPTCPPGYYWDVTTRTCKKDIG